MEKMIKMSVERDKEYLRQMAKGSTAAFESLFRLYYPKLKNFLRSLLKNEDEACDIAQDIFIKIWNKRVIFSQVGSFESYLFRMAKNAVYDYFEHNLVKERYIFINAFNISELDQISEDKIFAKDLEVLISMALEKMPDKRKNVFFLSRRMGLSNEDIANRLNIDKRTVENHITNALSDIRKVVHAASLL